MALHLPAQFRLHPAVQQRRVGNDEVAQLHLVIERHADQGLGHGQPALFVEAVGGVRQSQQRLRVRTQPQGLRHADRDARVLVAQVRRQLPRRRAVVRQLQDGGLAHGARLGAQGCSVQRRGPQHEAQRHDTHATTCTPRARRSWRILFSVAFSFRNRAVGVTTCATQPFSVGWPRMVSTTAGSRRPEPG